MPKITGTLTQLESTRPKNDPSKVYHRVTVGGLEGTFWEDTEHLRLNMEVEGTYVVKGKYNNFSEIYEVIRERGKEQPNPPVSAYDTSKPPSQHQSSNGTQAAIIIQNLLNRSTELTIKILEIRGMDELKSSDLFDTGENVDKLTNMTFYILDNLVEGFLKAKGSLSERL